MMRHWNVVVRTNIRRRLQEDVSTTMQYRLASIEHSSSHVHSPRSELSTASNHLVDAREREEIATAMRNRSRNASPEPRQASPGPDRMHWAARSHSPNGWMMSSQRSVSPRMSPRSGTVEDLRKALEQGRARREEEEGTRLGAQDLRSLLKALERCQV